MRTIERLLKNYMLILCGYISIAIVILFINQATNVSIAAENPVTGGQELRGGINDDGPNLLNANVVVMLGKHNCSGTLLSPTLVLTSRHCITGFAGGEGPGVIPGLGRKPLVYVGPDDEHVVKFESVDSVVFGDPIGGPYLPFDPKTIPENMGNDIAVVFLDPKKPVLNEAIIKRIGFRNPILGGSDVNGGTYHPFPGEQFGIAGWSRGDGFSQNCEFLAAGGPKERQVAFFPSQLAIHHYPGKPEHATGVADGQYWLRNRTGVIGFQGDSGGPYFIQHADGTREVFGVSSGCYRGPIIGGEDDIDCRNPDCDLATDITRGSPKEWLLKVVQDNTRSNEWLRFHKRSEVWYGEVDYTGVCIKIRDQDCDGWFDENDYCPKTYNPDQLETAGGVGQACVKCPRDICPPPPPNPPTNCRIDEFFTICGSVGIECDRPLPGGEYHVRSVTFDEELLIYSSTPHLGSVKASGSKQQKQLVKLCVQNISGTSCSNNLEADMGPKHLPNCDPSPGGGVGGVGGTGDNRCPAGQVHCRGGTCKPIAECPALE